MLEKTLHFFFFFFFFAFLVINYISETGNPVNRTTLVATRDVGRSLMGELMTKVVLTSTDMYAPGTGVGYVALL